VLDILVQEKRDGAAGKRFFKRLLQGLQYKPKRLASADATAGAADARVQVT
jgi:putative transposase